MKKISNRSTENAKAIKASMEEVTTPSIETNEGFELGTMVQENLANFIKSRTALRHDDDPEIQNNENCVAVAHRSVGGGRRKYNEDAIVAIRSYWGGNYEDNPKYDKNGPNPDVDFDDYDVVDLSKVKTFKYSSCSGSTLTFKRQGDDFLVEGKDLGSYTTSEMIKLLNKGGDVPAEAMTKEAIVSLSRDKYNKI